MSFLDRFSGLRWKLAFSYVGVTLVTVLALEAVVILVVGLFGPWIGDVWVRKTALGNASQLAELAADPLEAGSEERLTEVLDQSVGLVIQIVTSERADLEQETRAWFSPARVVIDPNGRVVASDRPERYPAGSRFSEPGLPQAEALVVEVLADGLTAGRRVEQPSVFAAAAPITNVDEKQLGVLYYRQPGVNTATWSSSYLVEPLAVTTAVLLPCMIPLGLIFGLVTALGFTRRLRRLTQASSALASGDLARRVHDTSGDEIGQLTRQFNHMAGQLEADTTQLRELAERNARLARQAQRLAALEERHRLARELHDGVKQHLFGVNLAAAAALNLLGADPEVARTRLLEAKEHSRQAQAEMEALLNELRPAGLDERGLIAALTGYLATFEQQQGIQVDWHMVGVDDVSLPLTHEQALYRVAQEALANVVRHARATHVTVELITTPEAVTLRVVDDGRGFDPAAVEPGATMGVQGMRERLAGWGGTLTIDATPGAGTRLTAHLPRPTQTHGSESHA
jgi:NarL family two-component system sensor histidine kinase LiaS